MLREAPKLPSVRSAFGEAKLDWLRTLNASASNPEAIAGSEVARDVDV